MRALVTERKTFMQQLLDGVEAIGNKVPHPAIIFLIMSGVVIVLSQLFHMLGTSVSYQVVDPASHEIRDATATVNSLLTPAGISFIITSVIRNFLGFGPVGVILVAMVGVGLAEEAGLIAALIRKIVSGAPRQLITFIIVAMGVLSSVASDAGYLVLIPLGASAFLSLGRHPIAGLAAAFAGVAVVFGVNLIITPVDAVLTEITNDAIHLISPGTTLYLTAIMWFSMVSAVVMCIVCTIVTERVVEPRLGPYHGDAVVEASTVDAAAEARGLRNALWALIGSLVVIGLLALPPGAPLRNPETGALIGDSPLMNSLIVLIAAVFFACGYAYGRGAGTIRTLTQAIAAITKTFAGLGGLIFLFLVISQFLAHFNYSNLATIAAVNLSHVIEQANMGSVTLLIVFVLVTFLVDLIIPAAIAKWAILAPIFVPLFLKLGVSPAIVLAAYHVGDSPANAVTPLMAYFGMIVIFAQKYQKDAGVGTVVAMMLPYTVVVFVVWLILLILWYMLGIPTGI
ncbi:AbgT family transporter [Rhodopila sp.]|jgi:aminobenzoyl-glutamate transport protein|uniref:AbgT family transporter n=1 Tax=Rhodopila sp. TaxID=2480087 RepID=UPI002C407F58|nr:AbgT family transporter [Rhodopila sp.]HVZ07087.1 AbgT family transporter [Rhodopila sp.]